MAKTPAEVTAPVKGMAWIPGGTFAMGSERHYPEEAPVREVTVDGFWLDEHPVTNLDFLRFVKATGHVTWAEREPDPADYPDADPEMLFAGSVVFQKSTGPVDLSNHFNWWTWTRGADWRHPTGPESSLHGRERHPVVHIAYSRRGGLRSLGRQGAADRGGVGVRRARWPRRRRVRLGRRVRAEGEADGEHVAGRVPVREHAPRRPRGHVAGRLVPAERLRPLRRLTGTSGSGRPTGTPCPPTSRLPAAAATYALRASTRTTPPRSRAG